MARIPYANPTDFSDDDQQLLKTSMDVEDLPETYHHLFSTDMRNVHRAIGNNPAILRGFRQSNAALWQESGLTKRQRELVILAVACTMDSHYEWHQHVRHALSANLTPAEVQAIADEDYDDFSDIETSLLAYAVATAQGAVGDECYAAITDQFDPSEVVGITMLASSYTGLARALDAMGVDPEEPFVGWNLEQL